jgi:hypothetical protein
MNSPQLTSPSPSEIFRSLCMNEAPHSFWTPEKAIIDPSADGEPEDELPEHQARGLGLVCTSDQPANYLETAETGRKALATKLRKLATKAKLDLKDRGVRSLHVGFGVAEWQEQEKNENVRSPIVMVPVALARVSRQKPWELSLCNEDIVLNPALAVKLQHDFGIIMPEVPENWDECSLEQYLKDIEKCWGQSEWSVADECWLGLFLFDKLPMYRDLDQNRSKLRSHPMISCLAGASTESGDSLEITCEPKDLDRDFAPRESFLVVDADSSQLAAIETVKLGTDIVLHGPPGTDKSQIITNIMAEMLAAGKSVLFVSEKMAAREVVFQRIERVGLGHLCLELHSHKTSRRAVIERLYHAMNHGLEASGSMLDADLDRLAQRRDREALTCPSFAICYNNQLQVAAAASHTLLVQLFCRRRTGGQFRACANLAGGVAESSNVTDTSGKQGDGRNELWIRNDSSSLRLGCPMA